jgi:hypothetical protein
MKLFIASLLLLASLNDPSSLPWSNPQIKIVDHEGKPVEGAITRIGFAAPPRPPQFEGDLIITKITDSEGSSSARERTGPSIGVRVSKDGYYPSSEGYRYPMKQLESRPEKWTPYAPEIQIVLKPVLNPIPLYVKRVETKIPADDVALGFDLQVGDWVTPHGKGIKSDLLFHSSRDITSPEDFDATLTLSFPNDGDGIILLETPSRDVSELRMPYHAPDSGYKPSHTWSHSREPGKMIDGTPPTIRQNYFIRVRTVTGSNGSIESAHYVKVHGDIDMYVGTKAPKAGLGFTYYFNPSPNDTNLEFIRTQNLFGGNDRYKP